VQYLILAYDYKDDNALKRRLEVRDKHIKLGNELKAQKKMLYGVAILDNNEKMIGSVLIFEFESEKELNNWLKEEPYVKNKVWEKIEVKQCKVGASFI
jgi:uncharacterized protein